MNTAPLATPSTDRVGGLPRLHYIGDVCAEQTVGSQVQLHRLFSAYPPQRLSVAVGSLAVARGTASLPGVRQIRFSSGIPRLLRTRFSRAYAAWLCWRAPGRSRRLIAEARRFNAEAVLSMTAGMAWLTAARLAEQLDLPLHLILHDDWQEFHAMPPRLRDWADRTFERVYRQAASRLCVSPGMAEEYRQRYGVEGQVLYPCRDPHAIVYREPPERLADPATPLVLGYAGQLAMPGYAEAVAQLGRMIEPLGGRVLVYSSLSEQTRQAKGLNQTNIEIRPFLPSLPELIDTLRSQCVALFCPMGFNPGAELLMRTCFPSKLVDFTSTGLPLLIWGPPHCSAVRWAVENAPVAEVASDPDPRVLEGAVQRLRNPVYRQKLARASIEVGQRLFSFEAVRGIFFDALKRPASQA